MKIFKLLALIILSIGLFPHILSAQTAKEDFKILAEGFQSSVDKPFVFIARDAETYKQLQGLVENLPDAASIDFSKNAVVAGFAGTKPTGGWSVAIKNTAGRITVDVSKPLKGLMLMQMITSPYKVALIPVKNSEALPLNLSTDWRSKMETYRVSKGNFEFSGGFAGRQKKFTADGTINILTYNNLATFTFYLKGTGIERKRVIAEIVSGSLNNEQITLARVDAGSFVDNPHPPLKVSGKLADSKLNLTFEPLPTNVADGYTGRGILEAVKIKKQSF